jgi:NTE family protein
MKIALALSGGGHRAAAFHLGVLSFLAKKNLVERVEVVSSTSGGSILAAVLFQEAAVQKTAAQEAVVKYEGKLTWPSSEALLSLRVPRAEALIVNKSLENDFIKRMFHPVSWLKFGHRANLMADVIRQSWGVSKTMKDLPDKPSWIINGTANVSGSRWFVRKTVNCQMGSEDIGLADASDFPIADAIALSAAYPGVIGPYRLAMDEYQWRYAESAEEGIEKSTEDNQNLVQSKKGLYLSDGGLYDNLGIEPLFNLEQSSLAYPETDFLIVSDAGSSLQRKRLAPVWRPLLRIRRLINVINQQVRVLRLRTLLPFFKSHPDKGLYIPMGVSFFQWEKERLEQGKGTPQTLAGYEFLSSAQVKSAKNTHTSLGSLSSEQFKLLLRHGFESAMIQFSLLDGE